MQNETPSPHQRRPGCGRIFLILLVLGGLFLIYGFIPASAATVVLKPAIHRYTDEYDLLFTKRPSTRTTREDQIKVQTLETTHSQSKVVPATGKGTKPIRATGKLNFSQIVLTGRITSTIDDSIITSNSGVRIQTSSVSVVSGGTATVSAFAVEAGSGGNIPAYDINGRYTIVEKLTQIEIGTAYIVNAQPFTGGRDGGTYTAVQQKDVDTAANEVKTKLLSDSESELKKKISGDTQMVPGSKIECKTTSTPNPKIGSAASTVDVKISVTCTVDTYSEQELFDVTANLQVEQVEDAHGAGYVPHGRPEIKYIETITDGNFVDGITLSRSGNWIYNVDPQKFAQNLAGKPIWWAQSEFMISGDFASYAVSTAGFGGSFPHTPNVIKVQTIP